MMMGNVAGDYALINSNLQYPPPLPLGDSICNKNLRLWVGFPFLLQKEVQIIKTLYGNGHNFSFYHKMKHKAADKTLK